METIGRIDKADFPELSLSNINIKVDTGAYTSTIHSDNIRETKINGEDFIVFHILDPSHPEFRNKEYKTNSFKKKIIKNSFGESEERFIIKTKIVLFGVEYIIDLSLSERSNMKYPILIGRKLLKGRFIVDTTKKNMSYKQKKSGKRKQKKNYNKRK